MTGDGKTIEAANTKAGIISGTVNTENAVWATRILEDNEVVVDGGIGEVNATTDMYGTCLGNFKITYYCACGKSVVIKQMELQQQEAMWQKEEPLQLIQV